MSNGEEDDAKKRALYRYSGDHSSVASFVVFLISAVHFNVAQAKS
jgi:hypothetical protein